MPTSEPHEQPDVDKAFGQRVERLRERLEWSQTELARKMKDRGFGAFHQTTISRVEKGERPVRLGEAVAFAEIFNRPLEAMLTPPSAEIAPDAEIMRVLIRRTLNWQNDAIQAITKFMWLIENVRDSRAVFLEKPRDGGPPADDLIAILKEYDELFGRDVDFLVKQAKELYAEVQPLQYFKLVEKKLDELWPASRARARKLAEQRQARKQAEAQIEGPSDVAE